MIDDRSELESFALEAAGRCGLPASSGPGLLSVGPSHVQSDFRKLRKAVHRHRVVILRRGAVVAVTTLVSIGGALLLHALFAGLFAWGIYFPWGISLGDGRRAGTPDQGGAPSVAFVAAEEMPAAAGSDSPDLRNLLGTPSELAATPVDLPELPDRLTAPSPSVASEVSLDLSPVEELGSVKVPTPPSVSRNIAENVVSAAQTGDARPGVTVGRPGPVNVAQGGFADERVFSLRSGDGTGRGRGIGDGVGNGIDRGMSAANRPAQPLNGTGARLFRLPADYELKPPEKNVRLALQILPDGSIGEITLTQSCGVPEIDELVRAHVRATMQFSPAFRDGKAVTSEFLYSQLFRPFD